VTAPFSPPNLQNPTVVKILTAAGAEFAARGYQGASTKLISQRAGVSKSLLHYHFQSKEHILFELQGKLFRDVAASVRRMSMAGTPSMDQALAALDKVWEMTVQVKQYIPLVMDLWKLSVSQPKLREQQDALELECLALLVAGLHQTLGPHVDDLIIPAERVAQLLLATLGGLAMQLMSNEAVARQSFVDLKMLLGNLLVEQESNHG